MSGISRVEQSRSSAGRIPRPLDWVLGLVVAGGLIHFGIGHITWLRALWTSLGSWLIHPSSTIGRTRAPSFTTLGILVALLLAVDGYMAAGLLLDRSRLGVDRPLRVALAVPMGASVGGYLGMLAVVFGVLERTFLLVALLLSTSILVFAYHRSNYPRRVHVPRRHAVPFSLAGMRRNLVGGNWIVWVVWGVVAVVVALVAVHAATSPVTEWDSLIYHAAASKDWFLSHPRNAAVHGPSLGIEISGNYPPLWPALGATLYTVAGHFDDFWVRILNPLMFASLIVLAHGWARFRYGHKAGLWAAFLTATTPLVILYGNWPTNYLLLALLGITVLMTVDIHRDDPRWRWLIAIGLVAGAAALTNFFGWLVVATAMAGVAAVFPRRWRLRGALLVLGLSVLTAAPWLLRNFVLLGDPVYPLSIPFLHPAGLTGPIWSATTAEVRSNALSYWAGTAPVRLSQVGTVLVDRHLLAIGLAPVAISTAWSAKRDRTARLILISLLGLGFAQLIPGWFWLRALLPVCGPASVGGGELLARFDRAVMPAGVSGLSLGKLWLSSMFSVLCAVVLVGALVVGTVVGIGLALAGPNQGSWTTLLDRSSDLMEPVRDLGSPTQRLWAVFGGDALAWQWVNQHTSRGARVATLEDRTYYLDRPTSLFYLDGSEADPLVRMHDVTQEQDYLRSKGVRWILVPAWAGGPTPTRDPVIDMLPLFRQLGGPGFPIVASFAETPAAPLTVAYSVGGDQGVAGAAVWAGQGDPAPTSATSISFSAAHPGGAILAPLLRAPNSRTLLSFEYRGPHGSRLTLSSYSAAASALNLGLLSLEATGHGWQSAALLLSPTRSGVVSLLAGVRGGTISARRVLEQPVPVSSISAIAR